jgi:alkanesulfonate monooxygenase SsuD/methylene tetrahydromethanopterin reductase-like flavin-dependent oxidoreductase (luciferase family)
MEAYRIGDHIIAADTEEDARHFYKHEVGKDPPPLIEELNVSLEVPAGDGKTATIRDLMNKIMDERCAWLRLGVPCDLHFPFIVAKLK